jgi:hypothetical protein
MASLLEPHRRPFPIVPKDRSTRRAWWNFPLSIQQLILAIWTQSKAVAKKMAGDALTGILDGNFQIKVR